MRELKLVSDDRAYTYQVPERYAEMNERQFRAAMMRLMRLTERETFWENFVGIPRRFCGSLPEWIHLEMTELVEFIPRMNEKLNVFIIERLPLHGKFLHKWLYAPQPMLGNVSLQQFMSADNFFSYYTVTQRESYIDLLCASLYLRDNETFVLTDKHDRLVPLDQREAFIHKHVPTEVRFGIFVNWIFVKNWLSDIFPHLFQRGTSDGKPKASDWLPVFDSFVGDNIPFIQEYQRLPCMDAFRIIDGKIARQQGKK